MLVRVGDFLYSVLPFNLVILHISLGSRPLMPRTSCVLSLRHSLVMCLHNAQILTGSILINPTHSASESHCNRAHEHRDSR